MVCSRKTALDLANPRLCSIVITTNLLTVSFLFGYNYGFCIVSEVGKIPLEEIELHMDVIFCVQLLILYVTVFVLFS